MIDISELKRSFSYDEKSGFFYWKTKLQGIQVGDRAGHINKRGYQVIQFKGVRYRGARLAWAYVTGVFPDYFVDHINGITSDDSFSNLRLATPTENNCNRHNFSRNKSGYRGVHYQEKRKKWCASIQKNGKCKNLGRFDTAELAFAAYCKAAKELHGEFANLWSETDVAECAK